MWGVEWSAILISLPTLSMADRALDKTAATTTLARLAGKRKARRGGPPGLSAYL
jgi:hypothetical protein